MKTMDGKDIILDILLNQDHAKYNLDETYVYFRCPFCGDSMTNRSETSFNVRIPDEEIPKWLYLCFRSSCDAKGVIDANFLRMLNHDNYDANVYLNKINRLSKKDKKFQRKGKRAIENFPSPDNRLSIAKLDYINKRLGTELVLKDLVKLKIHTDFQELYNYNQVKCPIKKQSYYKTLSLHGLSFISAYNDYLIVRNATNNKKVNRYTIVDIFENDREGEKFKFYIIPTKIDVMSVEPIVINMTEGTFDILSVYYNLDIDSEYNNHIHISVSGSSYEKVLIHMIRQYGLVDIIVNIFSDDNISLDVYEKLYKRIKRYTNTVEMTVYYNKLENDFGFPESRIKAVANTIF